MVKTISASKIRTFIPEFDGNRDLSPSEQIKIHYKAPTVAMKDKLFPRVLTVRDGVPEARISIDRAATIVEMLSTVENLAAQDEDGVIQKIVTVKDFLSAPVEFDGLVEEVYSFFSEVLNGKVNEKN